jgi:hypothetical protein
MFELRAKPRRGTDIPDRRPLNTENQGGLGKWCAPEAQSEMRRFVGENVEIGAIAPDEVVTNLTADYTFVSVCNASHWFIRSPTSHISA